jgi:pimeloyl-ACP methyl ester carboxylesterase
MAELGPVGHQVKLGDPAMCHRRTAILFVQTAAWSFIWRDVITQLQPSLRCVAFDFPRTGLSSPGTLGGIRLETYVQMLEEVCGRLQLNDLTLVMACCPRPSRLHVQLTAMAQGQPPAAA